MAPGDGGPVTASRFIHPVVQESTPSKIAAQVRDAIGHGDIAPGSQLHEAALAAQLGVSRGPLREGLQRLTQEGLLISIRNRGLFVIEMNPDDVRDLYVAREAVERAAAACVHRADPERTGRLLLEIVGEMGRAAADDDAVGVSDQDILFHQELVAGARSARLSRIHQTLLTETRMCVHALEETYAFSDTRVGEHHGIAESLVAGDGPRTDDLLVEHMADAVDRLTRPGGPGGLSPRT